MEDRIHQKIAMQEQNLLSMFEVTCTVSISIHYIKQEGTHHVANPMINYDGVVHAEAMPGK